MLANLSFELREMADRIDKAAKVPPTPTDDITFKEAWETLRPLTAKRLSLEMSLEAAEPTDAPALMFTVTIRDKEWKSYVGSTVRGAVAKALEALRTPTSEPLSQTPFVDADRTVNAMAEIPF